MLFDFDTGRRITALARDILRTLGLNTLRELTSWAQTAQKNDLARLTPLLFDHDSEVREILQEGAEALATACRRGMPEAWVPSPDRPADGRSLPQSTLLRSPVLQPWRGVARLRGCRVQDPGQPRSRYPRVGRLENPASRGRTQPRSALHLAATEQPNPDLGIWTSCPRDLVSLFVREERLVEEALGGSVDALARAGELVTETLGHDGRLFYVGAGTSGRLGVLDASEMPPTFWSVTVMGCRQSWREAPLRFRRASKAPKMTPRREALAIRERGVTRGDVVCGITSSGRTPFVQGALRAARATDARTIL